MHKELVQEVKGPQGPCHETVTCEPELTSSCGAESELALLAGDIKEQPFPGRRTAASPMMPAKYEEEEGKKCVGLLVGVRSQALVLPNRDHRPIREPRIVAQQLAREISCNSRVIRGHCPYLHPRRLRPRHEATTLSHGELFRSLNYR